MIRTGTIEGKYINLRAVTLEDAEFIIEIRNDTNKNCYIHETSTDVVLQRQWISRQIEREGDYYFVICDKSGNSIGLVSVYDIGKQAESAEFGRWISWGNAMQNVESAILSFDFAFEELKLNYLYMRMLPGNKKVINFWRTFGGNHIGEVYEDNMLFDKTIVTRDDYLSRLRDKNVKLLRYEVR